LGLERAGFKPLELVELEPVACETLRLNRPRWNVIQADLRDYSALHLKGQVDLLAGGVPCPPFSLAGKQLGPKDPRDLFPQALRLVKECKPRAVMLENVRGLLHPAFDGYRSKILRSLKRMGYQGEWQILLAQDFGVAQLRPRAVLVATRKPYWEDFIWPKPTHPKPLAVGEELLHLMSAGGWRGAKRWAQGANRPGPTLVGGSRLHGGADLGPTRARKAWQELGVEGKSLADQPPPPGFTGTPRLTLEMVARLQGFPPDWKFAGGKTACYRQIGNAFPAPVAQAVGRQIKKVLVS